MGREYEIDLHIVEYSFKPFDKPPIGTPESAHDLAALL